MLYTWCSIDRFLLIKYFQLLYVLQSLHRGGKADCMNDDLGSRKWMCSAWTLTLSLSIKSLLTKKVWNLILELSIIKFFLIQKKAIFPIPTLSVRKVISLSSTALRTYQISKLDENSYRKRGWYLLASLNTYLLHQFVCLR